MALECAALDASKEACASLEDGVPAREPHNGNRVVGEAPSEIVVGSSFSARHADAYPRKPRLPNRLMLGSYVLPQEWDCLLMDTVAPGSEAAREIIDHWSPFNKRESLVISMHDLYPNFLRVPVVTRAEE